MNHSKHKYNGIINEWLSTVSKVNNKVYPTLYWLILSSLSESRSEIYAQTLVKIIYDSEFFNP